MDEMLDRNISPEPVLTENPDEVVSEHEQPTDQLQTAAEDGEKDPYAEIRDRKSVV